jgi:hypothetical protein
MFWNTQIRRRGVPKPRAVSSISRLYTIPVARGNQTRARRLTTAERANWFP